MGIPISNDELDAIKQAHDKQIDAMRKIAEETFLCWNCDSFKAIQSGLCTKCFRFGL